jgi:hypothetical protein
MVLPDYDGQVSLDGRDFVSSATISWEHSVILQSILGGNVRQHCFFER